ncbi:MAG: hypothetical protein ACPGVB_00305 [Chitinophagales bacterium]
MKTPSTDLFDLIHSLTSQERAYFKRFASIHKKASDNTYLKLFDAILQQEAYDEQALKEQFRGYKVSQYFPRAKKYLEAKILDAMSLFHAEDSMSVKLKRQINDTRFLYSKQLFKMALKKAQQIKKEAAEWEYWAEYIAGCEIEISIFAKYAYKDIEHIDILKGQEENNLALEKYKDTITHFFYQREMVYLLVHRTDENKSLTENLFHKIHQKDNLKGITSQIARLSSMGLYYQSYTKDFKSAMRCFDEGAKLFEDHPIILRKAMDFYLFFVGRLLELAILQSSFETVQTYLQKTRKNLLNNPFLRNKEKGFQFVVKVEYYHNHLNCLFSFGKHEQTLQALAEADKEIKGRVIEVHVAYALRYHDISMLIYLFHEQFDAALEEVNESLNLEIDRHPTKERMRLWALLIHWELGNYDLLEHLIRNTIRYWKKNEQYDDWKQVWVKHLRQLLKGANEIEIWGEIYSQLSKNYPSDEGIYVDVWEAYIRSKLSKKPLKEIHQQWVEEKKQTQVHLTL